MRNLELVLWLGNSRNARNFAAGKAARMNAKNPSGAEPLPPAMTSSLNFTAFEEVVFFAAGAVRALEAADKQNRNAHRDQDGEDAFVGRKPMNQYMHTQKPNSSSSTGRNGTGCAPGRLDPGGPE